MRLLIVIPLPAGGGAEIEGPFAGEAGFDMIVGHDDVEAEAMGGANLFVGGVVVGSSTGTTSFAQRCTSLTIFGR
jgi:hypothetical protein